jgi:ribose transport system ATP-binding protein
MDRPALAVHRLTKHYPGTAALTDVAFAVRPGRFHALLGGNGSGKSTLIKLLAGVEKAEPGGRVCVGDQSIDGEHLTPAWAADAGLRFVHQEPALFETLSVAENIALTAGYGRRFGLIDPARTRARTREALASVGLADLHPATPIAALRPALRTLVVIARALRGEGTPDLLVLDEPTASLPDREADLLLDELRRLVDRGVTVLYVTHRLKEVIRCSDDVTVLRDGQHVVTRPVGDLTEDDLAELIVGRPLGQVFPPVPPDHAAAHLLSVRGLRGAAVRDVSFFVAAGEVLGIAGTVGSGRSTLLRLLFGAAPVDGGDVALDGRPAHHRSPADAMRNGIAYVPEDRQRDAAFALLAVELNLAAAQFTDTAKRGWLDRRGERARAAGDVRALSIRTSSVSTPFGALSGGNQQKVVLGRWLRRRPRLLLLDEPTQGVDVGARADIYALIRAAAADGTGVVVVSSDFDELAGLCDRVLVMAKGRVVAERSHPDREWIAQESHRTLRRVS